MTDEQPRATRRRRELYGLDGRSPLLYFDSATAHVVKIDVTLSLIDTQRDPSDPDKTPVRYLRTQLKGAKALRAALDHAIARLEGRPPKG